MSSSFSFAVWSPLGAHGILYCCWAYIDRLDDLDSRSSSPSASIAMNKCGFNIEGLGRTSHATNTPSKSFKKGVKKGSEGLKSIGRSFGFGVSRAVFPEDLKVSEKKIFDPQDKFLLLWNKLFVISCILAVSIDPLFFYLPVYSKSPKCLGIDRKLAIVATTLRTVIDVFYLIHMALQFRTAYIAPSSRVFGRGELVIDPKQIAKRYLWSYFIIDFLAVLPIPQVWLSSSPNLEWYHKFSNFLMSSSFWYDVISLAIFYVIFFLIASVISDFC